MESRPEGAFREPQFEEQVDVLLACEPAVIVVIGPSALADRYDWAVNTSARVACALGSTGEVSGVILRASSALAADVVEAFQADGLPVSETTTWQVSRSVPSRSVPSRSVPSRSVPSRSVPSRSVQSVSWALARGEFTGTTLLIELPRTSPERARAAGAALALVMASRSLSWGLLGYGGAAELQAERQLVAGAHSVERILRAVGA